MNMTAVHPTFSPDKAIQDAFYNAFPARLLDYVRRNAKEGDVSSVISTIDYFCYNIDRAMNIGDVKGKILDAIVIDSNPNYVLELGTFCGYSALRIVRLLKPETKFYTVDINPECAKVARSIIEFGGMGDRIAVLCGNSATLLPSMAKDYGISGFDLVFLDHAKDQYKSDLILLEDCNLIRKGSVVVADNVIYPGCPDYLEYVRNNPNYACTNFPSKLEYDERDDAIEKSVYCPQ